MPEKKILLIAGEVSADQHGAKLIRALKHLEPDLKVWGIGGDELAASGMELVFHLKKMAFLGVSEVIRHLPFIRKVMKTILNRVEKEPPDCAVLIDYPGFNLRLAAQLKKRGIPVIYYISPQLWAWGGRRVHKVRKYVDKMLVLFPFEKTFYERHHIQAEYVGHPLVDRHHDHVPNSFKAIDPNDVVLGLLPGSRQNEIRTLLPKMVETARRLLNEGRVHRVLILKAPHLRADFYAPFWQKSADASFRLVEEPMHTFLPQLDAALVASGTATLETAYFAVPMVIVYHVHNLTYWLGRLLVKIDHIGLANIVAEREVAPELIQNDFTPERAVELLRPMFDPQTNREIRSRLLIVRQKLGEPGASLRAAKAIQALLNRSTSSGRS